MFVHPIRLWKWKNKQETPLHMQCLILIGSEKLWVEVAEIHSWKKSNENNKFFRHNCCKLESLLLLSQQHQQQSENPGCYKLKLFIFNASLHPSHCLYILLLLTFSCNIICVFVPRREVYVISEKMKIGIILKRGDDRKFRRFFFNKFSPSTWC